MKKKSAPLMIQCIDYLLPVLNVLIVRRIGLSYPLKYGKLDGKQS